MAQIRPRVTQWRGWFNAFVARHELAWDLSLAGLALVYLFVGLLEDHAPAGWDTHPLAPVELVITAIFLGEFALRFSAAESRRTYLRRHWIDLLALLPSVRALRFLRLGRFVYLFQAARFLRVGVLVRLVTELDRASKEISWVARRNGVHLFFAVAAGLVVLGGLLVWELESPTNSAFRNPGDAIWWAFATMTTVGYGSGPMTVAGRTVAALIMIVGVGCFGVLTATISAYFTRRAAAHAHVAEVTPHDLMAALDDIRARLERLEQRQIGGKAETPDPAAVADALKRA